MSTYWNFDITDRKGPPNLVRFFRMLNRWRYERAENLVHYAEEYVFRVSVLSKLECNKWWNVRFPVAMIKILQGRYAIKFTCFQCRKWTCPWRHIVLASESNGVHTVVLLTRRSQLLEPIIWHVGWLVSELVCSTWLTTVKWHSFSQ